MLQEIHDLCFHGNGGFTYSEVYSLPVMRRKYHIKKIVDHFEQQRKQLENQNNQQIDNKIYSPPKPKDNVFNVKKAQ